MKRTMLVGAGDAFGVERPVSAARLLVLAAAATLVAACSSDQTPQEPQGPRPGPARDYNPDFDESVFGEDGISVGTFGSGRGGVLGAGLFGEQGEGGRLPVNKYLWQGALDTLSFLPLASSDPFTGVIATEWSTTPETPGERFKVTAYVTSSALSAGALKVAAYREVRNEDGVWVPAPVSPETARQLEDAILTRAREIRIADRQGSAAS